MLSLFYQLFSRSAKITNNVQFATLLSLHPLRTGSIGNRDAENLIGTLVEPKKSTLAKIRASLLSLGYVENADYDAINVESYVSYALSNIPRFILKHKWELVVILILHDQTELSELLERFPNFKERQFEQNQDDAARWVKLDPFSEMQLINELANFYGMPNNRE